MFLFLLTVNVSSIVNPLSDNITKWSNTLKQFVGKLCEVLTSCIYYIYIYIYIYINLRVNAIIRLPHPWSGDSQGQETFLAPSADNQNRKYHTECSNHHPSLSTLR